VNSASPYFERSSRQGKTNYFFQTLQMMSEWDGSKEALNQKFPEEIPQSQYYKNLNDLFEQSINDVVAFKKGLWGSIS
jgi:hypothetical protein